MDFIIYTYTLGSENVLNLFVGNTVISVDMTQNLFVFNHVV